MIAPRVNTISFYASLLEARSPWNNSLRDLEKVHTQTITLGIASHEFIRTKLIAAYASFFQMQQAAILFSFASRKPTFLYNTLIRAYASVDNFSDSLSLFRRMNLEGKPIDRHTLPVVSKSCGGLSNPRLGKQVHAAVVLNGYASDTANSNALITMYAKCGDLRAARKVFDEMPDRNEISYSAMMASYGMHGNQEGMCRALDEMVEAGVRPDGASFTSMLAACSHLGMVDKGKGLFKEMEEKFGVKPRLEHYTCMVDMMGRAGKVEEAKEVIMGMKDVQPDEALWRSFLAACKIHGRAEFAQQTFKGVY